MELTVVELVIPLSDPNAVVFKNPIKNKIDTMLRIHDMVNG
jgi:hypothetical protein